MDIKTHGIVSQGKRSEITVSFEGSTTYITNTADEQEGWRNVVITGMQPGDVITINYTMECDIDAHSDPAEAEGWVRMNAGGWFTEWSASSTDSSAETRTNVDDEDTVDLKIYAFVDNHEDWCQTKVTLTGGTVTTGSGTVTATGTTDFIVYAGTLPF